MAMPKFHELMRPVLAALSAAECLSMSDLRLVAAEEFSMTEDEQQERLASGQLRIANRLGWAITDLSKAGLLERIPGRRGLYRITDEGRTFLSRHDSLFNVDELMAECEPFREWRTGYREGRRNRTNDGVGIPTAADEDEQTPQEVIAAAEKELRDSLVDELVERIMEQDSDFFEYLVGKLLSAMGYGSEVEVTRRTGDEGIDGVVREDRLGFDNIYYQAKRWDPKSTVSRPEIQKFVGALSGKSATKGLFITTARFSDGAVDYAERQSTARVVLVDGQDLARLMIDTGVGVSVVETYEVKAIDTDFFDV